MVRTTDADLDFKLRFKRLLFGMGYYCPLEVVLSQYFDDSKGIRKRADLTDIDVLGLKYDLFLNPHRIVCDCKSGRNVSNSNRLFWLRGVCDYFEADLGYFLRTRIDTQARSLAPKLKLRVLDENELSELEKTYQVEKLVLPITDQQFYETRQSLWGIEVAKGNTPTADQIELKQVYSYLSYMYWFLEQHRNLFSLISRFSKISHLLNATDPRAVLLAYSGLERFAHCLLEAGAYIHSRGISDIPKNTRIYVFGGYLALREREELFDLLRATTGIKDTLDPPYFKDTLEVINRMLHNPAAASKVLLYLEAVYGWCVQLNNRSLEPVFKEGLDIGTIVLARDMCIHFCQSAGLDENLFSVLFEL